MTALTDLRRADLSPRDATARTDRTPPFDAGELLDADWVDDDSDDAGDDDRTVVTALPFEIGPAFIGRTAALDRLVAAFDSALTDRALRFVTVTGEPGMGRSRVIAELARRVQARCPEAAFLIAAGDEPGASRGPIPRLLAQYIGIVVGAPAAEHAARIDAAVAAALPAAQQAEVAHLLADLLEVPIADSPVLAALAGSPRQRQTRTFLAVRRFVAAAAAQRPLVLVLEDLERCSMETLHLLQFLAAGLRGVPVLLVGTATPALREEHPTFGEGDVAPDAIELPALTAGESEALLRELLRQLEQVPAALIAHARALGGSPRALRELVDWLVDTGCLVRAAGIHWRVDGARLAASALPTGVDGLIAARLTAMDAADRRVLEMAAAIGDPLSLDAVVALHRGELMAGRDPDGPSLAEIEAAGDDDMAARLAALHARGWLAEVGTDWRGEAGERPLRFAYPELREAVEHGTAPDARRRYHAAAARWLALGPGGRSAAAQETIARHLELAGELALAAARHHRAADAARSAFHNDRAIGLYQRALACLGDHDVATRLDLWHDLGSVYELIGDVDAALAAFERMQRLAWVAASKTQAAIAWQRIGRVRRRRGDPQHALAALERGHELFLATGDDHGVAGSVDDIGATLALLGRNDEAFQHVTRALALRGKAGAPRPIAVSLSNLGRLQHRRGQLDAAATCHREALALHRQIADRRGALVSMTHLAALAFDRGDLSEARTLWASALAEAEAIGARPLSGQILCHQGELALAEGKLDEAQRRLADARAIARDVDDCPLDAACLRLLARVENQAGRTGPAGELAQQALRAATEAGLPEEEALALLTLGQVMSASLYDADRTEVTEAPGASPAEPYFRRAIDLLRRLGSEVELAKALDAYGRFLVENGQVGAGKDLLGQALASFVRLGLRQAADVERVLRSV